MHELALCRSIADIVRRTAAERRVVRVHLRIGELRQVVPDTLVYCWSMTSAGTDLDGAELVVDRVPARLRCPDCGHVSAMGDFPDFGCAACDGASCEVESGEEFLITAMDLVET
ncbi:MAG TPA: hydrogenase maturation nickel metallochaperone HypA [Jatrophihabitans sp.]|uniref:hydrogenase maturation nickel metallochaperone HypA n=1 Tax=Jatrophihabitans sp. TaxID=1932789 RepID=UPI002DF7B3B9|nr:hydrogenase maturation nickel metallochaperone HypA [Jatrophihabitans sp.]